MGIRTILYGYETRDGQKAIRESEAETVRLIFRMYLSGFSYHKITEALNKRNIPYGDGESPWNKARVKRILEDRRYAGENGYPKLIAEDTLQAVQNAKAGRLSRIPPTQTEPKEGQPILRRLHCAECGTPLSGHGGRGQKPENLYLKCPKCGVSFRIPKNSLSEEVERQLKAYGESRWSEYQPSGEVVRLTNAINRALERPDRPEEAVALILQGVSARYECCPDPDRAVCEAMSAEQMENAIERVSIFPDSTIAVRFRPLS